MAVAEARRMGTVSVSGRGDSASTLSSLAHCESGQDQARMGARKMVFLTALFLGLCSVRPAAGGCSRYEKECPGDKCVPTWRECPKEDCELLQKRCPDGSCIDYLDACQDECRDTEKKCSNGQCVPRFSSCPSEDLCTSLLPNKCDNGKCYSHDQQCDDIDDCLDGTDERDCGGQLFNISKWPWWIIVLIAAVVVLLSLIIALWCRCATKQNRARRIRRAQRSGHQDQSPQEMPVVAGRRTQPVRGRTEGGPQYGAVPTGPPQGSHTPAAPLPPQEPFAPNIPQGGHPPQQGAYPPIQQSGAGGVQPSAPPLVLDDVSAPPPYHEVDPQQGIHGRDYLPSYETAQRNSPSARHGP